jgi:hypothetical protein
MEILLTLEFLRFRDIRLLLSYFFTGSGVILESDGDIIRCCGLIKEWEIYKQNKGERQKYKKTNKTKVKGKVLKDKQNKGERQKYKKTNKTKEWEIYAKKTGTLKIIVWRPTKKAGEESKRTIVGINTFTVSSKTFSG